MSEWHQRFERHYTESAPDECWPWQSSKSECGYGRFMLYGKSRIASRLAFEIAHGQIPEGRHVLHKCDNSACVNPDHLFLGDHKINMADRNAKGRARGGSLAGELHPMSKLTNVQTNEIRALALTRHLTQKEIARRYGISQPHVSSIRNSDANV